MLFHACALTVKLRGRTTTPDKRRGRTISSGARGAKLTTPHGPLQRLLERRRLNCVYRRGSKGSGSRPVPDVARLPPVPNGVAQEERGQHEADSIPQIQECSARRRRQIVRGDRCARSGPRHQHIDLRNRHGCNEAAHSGGHPNRGVANQGHEFNETAAQKGVVLLTVKLNGRAPASDWRRGRTISCGARGA